jgi:hypothetical protein
MRAVGLIDLYQYTERAVKVHRDYLLDREYVVRDGEIVIVDEFTGRLAEGRKWRDGIHQAIEAKEQVEVTVPTGQAARITIQDLFLRYRYLAGMTGTARSSAREFRKIYKMRVIPVPTNKPVRRKRLNARIFGTSDAKWQAIADEILEMHQQGRPVLIGTRSIDKSEHLSRTAQRAGAGASGSERTRGGQGSPNRRASGAVGASYRGDEHGGPRNGHQVGRRGGRDRRAARDCDRDARRGAGRPAVVRPLRASGRSGIVPILPGWKTRSLRSGFGPKKS